MKRREYLLASALSTSSLLFAPLFPLSRKVNRISKSKLHNQKIDKVKQAMLSMQRASWEQGVAAQAFLELGENEMVYLLAQEAVLRQLDDGRLSVLYQDNGVTDPAASGEVVLYAGKLYDDKKLKEAAEKMAHYLLEEAPRTESGIIYHILSAPEIWIDSMYMAPPFLAVAGHYQEAVKQIRGIRKYLWNPDKKLFSHRWNEEKKEFVNAAFWGVGNGWAAAGMSRVIKHLPSSMSVEKDELIHYIQEVINGCLEHIRPDYLFHNVLDDQESFMETNLSQMLAYAIFKGVKNKWLPTRYLDYAHKMRNAAHKKVDHYGFVQGVCGAPYFDQPGRATEGQAFFLLMEAACHDL